eukprot:TRINITY_DN2103_c0_g1_i4.p1 TRINITY_DN2103_c0_g1~~TRINITY_DN2103_c0_g1_i4.p1  ORF type:complete len:1585 (+),score=263.48 TRINITY_DN2103_c0_g1_i4:684-4757(+)
MAKDYYKFRFHFYEPCTNFSVSSRNAFPQVSDTDIFFSFTPINATLPFSETSALALFKSIDYLAADDGDDSLVLMNICSPNGESIWSVYMVVQLWRGNNTQIVVTASTDTGFTKHPVTSLSANQYMNSFTSDYASLSCGFQKFFCKWSSYTGNLDPFDPSNSCGRFGLLAPLPDPEPWRSPLWKIFLSSPFGNSLPWSNEEIARAEDNVPNRMAFYLLRQVTSGERSRKFSDVDIESCAITLGPKFVNKNGESFRPHVMGFTQKQVPCNHTAVEEIRRAHNDIINSTSEYETLHLLNFAQLKISMWMNRDVVLGCKQMLEDLLETGEDINTYEKQRGCNSNEYAPDYRSDPCCISNVEWDVCCDQNVTSVFPIVENVLVASVKDMCQTPRCANISLQSYKTNTANIHDRDNGCNAIWEKSAGTSSQIASNFFLCATKLWGPFEMLGVSCGSDSDCAYGANCDLFRGKCNYLESHLFECMDEQALGDKPLRQLLFNYWGVKKVATTENFIPELLGRYKQPMCSGPGSLAFRPHYAYVTPGNNVCRDKCTEDGVIINCLDTDTSSCPKDDICPPYNAYSCFRVFVFHDEILNDACEQEKTCNWMKCGSLNPAQCEEACLQAEPMCLDCTTTPCTNLTFGWDEDRCNQGLCVDHPEIDPESCRIGAGQCSAPCPGCDEAECQEQIYCDVQGYKDFLLSEGVPGDGGCFGRPRLNVYSTIICDVGILHPFGCLKPSLDETACNSEGFKWISTELSTEECGMYEGCKGDGFWNEKDQDECACAQQSWEPYFKVTNGTFTPGKLRPLIWTPPVWDSVRKVEPVLDFITLHEDLRNVVTKHYSLEYAKESLCRVTPVLDVISTISCDCSGDNEDAENGCFNDSVNEGTLIDMMWACPFLAESHEIQHFNLSIYATTFPKEYSCQVLSVSLLPNSFFTSQTPDARLSSHVFTEIPPNIYTIIYYQKLIIEGQIVTDGIRIQYEQNEPLDDPMTLCIPRLEDIPRADVFDTYEIGRIVFGDGESIYVERLEGEHYTQGVSICTNISEPGGYIGIRVRNAKSLYQSLLAQSIIASIIYIILLVGISYQIFCILVLKLVRKQQKLLFSSIAFLFLLIRAVYFIVYPIGVLEAEPIASYFVFEFPTFLFLVMNSTVIYLWLEISQTMKSLHLKGSGIHSGLFMGWIMWNTFILLSFIGFIVAYYVSPSGKEPTACSIYYAEQASKAKLDVSLAYVIFVAVLSIGMAVTFIVIGAKFLRMTAGQSSRGNKLLIYTWSVMSIFAVCFVVKSVLLLIAATTNFTIPILVFALLEQFPTSVLMWYVRPPTVTISLTSESGSGNSRNSKNSVSKNSTSTNVSLSAKPSSVYGQS